MRCCCFWPKVCSLLLVLLSGAGCASHAIDRQIAMTEYADIPRELDKTSFPAYRVEPPDILLIEAVSNIRTADAPLDAGDTVTVRLQKGLPILPETTPDDELEYQYELEREIANKIINGDYLIGADGTIDLGPAYGKVPIAGLSLDQARDALSAHLQQESIGIKEPAFTLTMPDVSGKQPITGEHLVRPDGTISLGIYGEVYVAGYTLPQVKAAVESHLSTQMHNPQVSVDVLAYNSKVIYVIMDGGGYGEQVIKLPCTGNETVLDAVSQVYGLSQVSSKKMWVARPAPSEYQASQILDVHWAAITREGITTTNYQLFPGDKLYVQADHLIATDNFLSKVFSPVERFLGVIALGTGTVSGIDFYTQQGQNP